jgi:hypothetical protein
VCIDISESLYYNEESIIVPPILKNDQNVNLAESYYNDILGKDFGKVANHLHHTVQFFGPLSEMQE